MPKKTTVLAMQLLAAQMAEAIDSSKTHLWVGNEQAGSAVLQVEELVLVFVFYFYSPASRYLLLLKLNPCSIVFLLVRERKSDHVPYLLQMQVDKKKKDRSTKVSTEAEAKEIKPTTGAPEDSGYHGV